MHRRVNGLLALVLALVMTRSASATVTVTITGLDGTSTSAITGPGGFVDVLVKYTTTSEQTIGLAYKLAEVSAPLASQLRLLDRNPTALGGTSGLDITDFFPDDTTVEATPAALLNPVNDHDLGGFIQNVGTPLQGEVVVSRLRLAFIDGSTPIGQYKFGISSSIDDSFWLDDQSTAMPFTGVAPQFTVIVPEPAGLSLLGVGLLALARRRR